MARFWHRVGVYFGFAEPDEAERRAMRETGSLSPAHALVRLAIAASLAGLIFGLGTESVGGGIVFGLSMAVIQVLVARQRRRF